MADQYEYKVVEVATGWLGSFSAEKTSRELDALGAEGWEIYHIESNFWQYNPIVFLRRPR